MIWFQIYILIGALIGIGFHRFFMSGLRNEILNAEFGDLGEHKNVGIFLVFAWFALTWPIFIIYFIARKWDD